MKTILYTFFFFFFSITVASAKFMVINGLTHEFKTEHGGVIQGKIELKNVGKTVERISIYKNDLVANCTGEQSFVDPNVHAHSNLSWVTTNVDEKILQPGEEYEILFTINIPKDTTLIGSYWSALMVEGGEPIKEEKKSGVTITTKARYAIQLITDIGDANQPSLTFEKIDIKVSSDSSRVIKVVLKNEGDVSARTKIMIDINNKEGEKVTTIESKFRRIYPNACSEYELLIKDLPKGKYDAILMADYGQDLFATNLNIDVN